MGWFVGVVGCGLVKLCFVETADLDGRRQPGDCVVWSGSLPSCRGSLLLYHTIGKSDSRLTLRNVTTCRRGWCCKFSAFVLAPGNLHIYLLNSTCVIKKPPKAGAEFEFIGASDHSPLSSIEILSSGAWILTVSTDSPMTRPMESRTWLAVCS